MDEKILALEKKVAFLMDAMTDLLKKAQAQDVVNNCVFGRLEGIDRKEHPE